MNFTPLKTPPTEVELGQTDPLPPVMVETTTYYDRHSGQPKYLKEVYDDPDTGATVTVWSRVTDALAYEQG